jgi:hypothetical protein
MVSLVNIKKHIFGYKYKLKILSPQYVTIYLYNLSNLVSLNIYNIL